MRSQPTDYLGRVSHRVNLRQPVHRRAHLHRTQDGQSTLDGVVNAAEYEGALPIVLNSHGFLPWVVMMSGKKGIIA